MRKDQVAILAARDRKFATLIKLAQEAAQRAFDACIPTPMTVRYSGKTETIADGMCGFAWVTVKPATSSLAKWLKQNIESMPFRIHSGCYGGLELWPRLATQSWERNKAWARAFADVLSANGHRALAGDRLD